MSLRYLNPEMTMETRRSCNGGRERLGLSFTIDYLLFNKGVKSSKEELVKSRTTVDNMPNHQSRKAKELVIPSEIQEKGLQRSDEENEERKVKEEEGVKSKERRGRRRLPSPPLLSAAAQRDLRTNIALISKAILTSDKKKLLLCDIYQWIMDHYPYFQSKDKNWRNSVRHNLSLNECFIKVGRSDNGKGHFWAIHPSNYQDFSNGEYHCRRARRRVRRVAAQLPFASLGSHFYPGLHRSHPTPCW